MSSHNTDIAKTLCTVNELLRVGMAEEALEKIRQLPAAHSAHADVQENYVRALHQKFRTSGTAGPELIDELLGLNLPPEHPLQTEILEAILHPTPIGSTADGNVEALLDQARLVHKERHHAEALELLRQIRRIDPDHQAAALLSAKILAELLRNARKDKFDIQSQTNSIIKEYLESVWPRIGRPCTEHSLMMEEMACHFELFEINALLFSSFRNWPEIFWMPEDLMLHDDKYTPTLNGFLTTLLNTIILACEMKNEPPSNSEDYRLIIGRLQRMRVLYPDNNEIPFLEYYAHQFADQSDDDLLKNLLGQFPNSPLGWQFWNPETFVPSQGLVSYFPSLCMALLCCKPGSLSAKNLHQILAKAFLEQGKPKEARAELLQIGQRPDPKDLNNPFGRNFDLEALLSPPWGHQPGEGNYDFYLEQARIACKEVGLDPDTLPRLRPPPVLHGRHRSPRPRSPDAHLGE